MAVTKTMQITGLEANLLLFGLDKFLGVNQDGKLQTTVEGYSLADAQSLRDRLFDAHQHPDED